GPIVSMALFQTLIPLIPAWAYLSTSCSSPQGLLVIVCKQLRLSSIRVNINGDRLTSVFTDLQSNCARILIIRLLIIDPGKVKCSFPGMIISPHAGFSAWDLLSGRNMIPSVWPVVYRVQNQPLMSRIIGQIRFLQ